MSDHTNGTPTQLSIRDKDNAAFRGYIADRCGKDINFGAHGVIRACDGQKDGADFEAFIWLLGAAVVTHVLGVAVGEITSSFGAHGEDLSPVGLGGFVWGE